MGRINRHGESGFRNITGNSIINIDAQQVARTRRNHDILIRQHLGRVGISTRLGIKKHLLVRNSNQPHTAARSRNEDTRTVVNRLGLVRGIEPGLFAGRKPAVGGRPLPGDFSRRLIDHHDPVLRLLGQNHHLRRLIQINRFLLVITRPPGNIRSLFFVFATTLKEAYGSQNPQIFFHIHEM